MMAQVVREGSSRDYQDAGRQERTEEFTGHKLIVAHGGGFKVIVSKSRYNEAKLYATQIS